MGESSHRFVVSGVICAGALVVGAMLGWFNRPVATETGTGTGTRVEVVPAAEPVIAVHVAGFVAHPGVVTLDEGALVADAVAAAGGLLVNANPDAINLAAPVSAGQQVVVPGLGDVGEPVASGGGDGLMSINQATAAELEELPGVGPVLAGRVIAHRESHGPFETVEDLLQVPGIGESKLASIRDLIRP